MALHHNDLHLWSTHLECSLDDIHHYRNLLSPDELERADRFHFETHQHRFIVARGYLRRLLATYLQALPQDIVFKYENNKPAIAFPETSLTFNLAHSDNLAIYGVTLNHAIGIDIEKIQDTFNIDLVKRFFSEKEYQDFLSLPESDQCLSFYRLWSRKEACVKACGKGLAHSLSRFSVAATDVSEVINIETVPYLLLPLSYFPGFQAAVAVANLNIQKISFWSLNGQHQPQLDNVIDNVIMK